MKSLIVAANWKLNKTPEEAIHYFEELSRENIPTTAQMIFFPPALCAESVSLAIKGTRWQWGGQNIHTELKGAFTGENSASTLRTMGAQHVLIGHSERRTLFGETDSACAKKVAVAHEVGLTPMLCLGETLEERQNGRTTQVLESQLKQSLAGVSVDKPLIVAYEPVWAIGTGVVAEPYQVQEAHEFLRKLVQQLRPAGATPLLYGGSVNAKNVSQLAGIDNVDGFLVGGASLEAKTFAEIARANNA